MRPYVALHRLGYKFCKLRKPVREKVTPNTAERQITKRQIKKLLENEND